jgi:alkylated DNA repair dioxygenase AlkB
VRQFSLFDPPPLALPGGLRLQPDFIAAEEEAELTGAFAELPFAPFAFQGWEGKRRVVSYGWRYDFTAGRALEAEPVPGWLDPLRRRAAAWAGLPGQALVQAMITEYAPGAPIGWHRDRPAFEDVLGVSFLSARDLRLRRRTGAGWERCAVRLEPRSIYLLRGEARTDWEHSILAGSLLRYSVTFRSLRASR